MKTPWFVVLLIILAPCSARSQQAVVVLAAAATSSAAGSAPITCLLDPGCQGYWATGSLDGGTDEGIYIQLDHVTAIDFIEIGLAPGVSLGDNAPWNLRLYLNGKTRNPRGSYLAEVGTSQILRFGLGNRADPAVGPFGENVKSVFLKIERSADWKPGQFRVSSIRFLKANASGTSSPIALMLPKLVPAELTATSILEPATAYHPANLFDSKYDIAWSTDGKKSDGKGESFTLTLNNPQTLSGILLWNGYQRSAKHFKANGRVLALDVQADALPVQSLKLADQMGPQKIGFSPPLINARQLRFTIKDIVPGSSYKDVLISELRLIGAQRELIAPVTNLPKVAPPAAFQGLLNRSFANILHQPITGNPEDFEGPDNALSKRCDNGRIRLRDNGTFVIYKNFNYGKYDSAAKPANINASVLEGNWEPKGDKVRIFGRKYVTALQESEYLQEPKVAVPQVQIFQSELSAKPYRELSPSEKSALFAFLWTKNKGDPNKNQKFLWIIGSTKWNGTDQNKKVEVQGANYDDLVKKMGAVLQELNPYYLNSSVLSGLFLPSDETDSCLSL